MLLRPRLRAMEWIEKDLLNNVLKCRFVQCTYALPFGFNHLGLINGDVGHRKAHDDIPVTLDKARDPSLIFSYARVDTGFLRSRTLASWSPFGIGDRNFAISTSSSRRAVVVTIAVAMVCNFILERPRPRKRRPIVQSIGAHRLARLGLKQRLPFRLRPRSSVECPVDPEMLSQLAVKSAGI